MSVMVVGHLGLSEYRTYANQCCVHNLPSVETVQNRDALAVAVVRSHNYIHNYKGSRL